MNSIDTDIWEVLTTHTMLGARFPLRMLVIRDGDGGLTLVSPVGISDELASELAAAGEVTTLIAPNLFHHMYLAAAAKRYPDAAIWAPAGLEKKRGDVRFTTQVRGDDTSVHVPAAGIELRAVGGLPGVGELSVFHAASRTMYTADMVMNITGSAGLYTRALFWIEGVWQRPAVPRLMRLLTKDKAALAATARHWKEKWAPLRIAPGHGALVENAAELLAREFPA
jgi:hypothetical protein